MNASERAVGVGCFLLLGGLFLAGSVAAMVAAAVNREYLTWIPLAAVPFCLGVGLLDSWLSKPPKPGTGRGPDHVWGPTIVAVTGLGLTLMFGYCFFWVFPDRGGPGGHPEGSNELSFISFGVGLGAGVYASSEARHRKWLVLTSWSGPALWILTLVGGCAQSWNCARVFADNGSPTDVLLRLDGQDWLRLDSGGDARVWLRMGQDHDLEVLDARTHRVLDKRAIRADKGNRGPTRYVLNVLGSRSYYRGEVTYGSPLLNPVRIGKDFKDVWFRPDVDYVLQDLPDHVTVSREGQFDTRTFLRRSDPAR